jgi:hypothetical protein
MSAQGDADDAMAAIGLAVILIPVIVFGLWLIL